MAPLHKRSNNEKPHSSVDLYCVELVIFYFYWNKKCLLRSEFKYTVMTCKHFWSSLWWTQHVPQERDGGGEAVPHLHLSHILRTVNLSVRSLNPTSCPFLQRRSFRDTSSSMMEFTPRTNLTNIHWHKVMRLQIIYCSSGPDLRRISAH